MTTAYLTAGQIRILEKLSEDGGRWQKLRSAETGIAFGLASRGFIEGKLWGGRTQVLWHITPLGNARLRRETAKRHVERSERVAQQPNRSLMLVAK